MFDNICKFLAENFSTDFATWLLGEPITFTELSPQELSLEPIRADALILLQSAQEVLHLEFQTQVDVEIPFRMLDYRVRVYRRFPRKAMHQVVIYLKQTNSDLVQQNTFSIPRTRHEFTVIRLWEQPTDVFLRTPGLLPLAVLSSTIEPEAVLNDVAQQINSITELKTQSNIAASTAILAGLVLDREVIKRVLRSDIMRDSVIYQDILEEGKAKGIAEGKAEALLEVAINLINTDMALEQIAKVTGLSIDQLQQLQAELESNNNQ
ncbi:Rpn family recombination-promoting nuclease/putative transposase [Tolypothrix sp. PCC 7910]|uniref:Rpn family recombination-promoting nuclease/putative transposase n=1 Tax=Tolypothrix sp. PCC 7910 TaxID=2099387 RepID=UPI00142778AC|nr:Rpn family recombination-promoting nuclease/putative transposase [Tolypothrix sp. PCC 7910]QIR37786.1 Rpn family recombination-promoting nuclease/putative transposase [Tolypothrix sp. PCC 7910]